MVKLEKPLHEPPLPIRAPDPISSIEGLDELGKLIHQAVDNYSQATSWETFVQSQRVEPPDLAAGVGKLPHPTAHLLKHLQVHGAPVPVKTLHWTRDRLDTAMR